MVQGPQCGDPYSYRLTMAALAAAPCSAAAARRLYAAVRRAGPIQQLAAVNSNALFREQRPRHPVRPQPALRCALGASAGVLQAGSRLSHYLKSIPTCTLQAAAHSGSGGGGRRSGSAACPSEKQAGADCGCCHDAVPCMGECAVVPCSARHSSAARIASHSRCRR